MSNVKWTPGPWEITEPNGTGNGMRIDGPKDWPRIPEAWLGFAVTSEEQIANAHVIAAAPDLYQALASCQSWITDGGYEIDPDVAQICDQARAALAKARGEKL